MSETPVPIDTQSIRSDALLGIRALLRTIEGLRLQIGPLAQFNLVIDANILIKEVRWLVLKRKSSHARTTLQECIAAGTITAYVAPHVIEEVREHLVRIAIEDGRSSDEYLAVWSEYERRLIVKSASTQATEKYAGGQDPDDAPTLALAEALGAAGILSEDSDIAAMGGKVVPITFILSARDYSRSAAISVTLELSGQAIFLGTGMAAIAAFRLIRGLARAIISLPGPVKIAALVFGFAWISKPMNRAKLTDKFSPVAERAGRAMSKTLETVLALMAEAEKTRPPPLKLPDA